MPQTQAQKEKIKAYLEKGKGLTALEALIKFGCFRLAARIRELSEEGVKQIVECLKIGKGLRVV